MSASLNELLADHENRHSDLQLERFITFKTGGTVYGCYKQALRELHARYTGIRDAYTQFAVTEIELQREARPTLLDLLLPFSSRLKIKRIKLDARYAILEESRRGLADMLREFDSFWDQANTFRDALIHEGFRFPLSREMRHLLDVRMWERRLHCTIVVESNSHPMGLVNASTLSAIHSMPPEERDHLLQIVFACADDAHQRRQMLVSMSGHVGHDDLVPRMSAKDNPYYPQAIKALKLSSVGVYLELEGQYSSGQDGAECLNVNAAATNNGRATRSSP